MSLIIESLGEVYSSASYVWDLIAATWFIVLPWVFYFLFKIFWDDYSSDKFWDGISWVLLEVIPPADIEKSPHPMELIYSGFLGAMGGINMIEHYVQGKRPLFYSLELVSDAGKIHFYIRTPKGMRSLVEAQIYAQYPAAEIFEVPDYVNDVPKLIPNKSWDLWGTEFLLDKPDPYPIKTYRFFEESVTGTMIDPMAGLIESMGKIGPNQQVWLQFIITPKDQSEYKSGKEIADKLAGRPVPKKLGPFQAFFMDIADVFRGIFSTIAASELVFTSKKEEKKNEMPVEFALTPGEKEVLKAIENSMGKSAFATKMRFVYLGRKENFDRVAVGSVFGSLKQFSDINLNGFKMDNDTKTYALHLFAQSRLLYRQRKILRNYRGRSRWSGRQFILNTEELATVFHFPDMAVISPAVPRVGTKRGSAPSNLPIG